MHSTAPLPDFQTIRGLEYAKRALEVAAAGGHHTLLIGAPGAGKTLLAQALPTILPSADPASSLPPPLCTPQARSTAAALFGRASNMQQPGMLAQAHGGVVLLDNLPAFGGLLDRLPAILDQRQVVLHGSTGITTYPADWMLIATRWPCPCGWYGDPERVCRCSNTLRARAQQRVSRALLEYFDIHLTITPVPYEQLSSARLGEPSAAIRQRVIAARTRQATRFQSAATPINAAMDTTMIQNHCRLDAAGQSLLKAAMRQLQLTARGYYRILRLARTIADLANTDQIGAAHLAEALQYLARPDE